MEKEALAKGALLAAIETARFRLDDLDQAIRSGDVVEAAKVFHEMASILESIAATEPEPAGPNKTPHWHWAAIEIGFIGLSDVKLSPPRDDAVMAGKELIEGAEPCDCGKCDAETVFKRLAAGETAGELHQFGPMLLGIFECEGIDAQACGMTLQAMVRANAMERAKRAVADSVPAEYIPGPNVYM